MDTAGLEHLLWSQDDVVSRSQLTERGAAPHDVRRLLRRRELVALHPGVYVAHTGAPSWAQRAQAAVLAAWPAALDARSALPAPAPQGPVEIVVARGRWRPSLAGVLVRSISQFDERVNWNVSPPRLRLEHAALRVAGAAVDEAAAFQVLADVCQTRRTRPRQLAGALASYARIPRRNMLDALLRDLEAGACSVLEKGYLDLVERAHMLPSADRQVRDRTSAGRCDRDVVHRRFGLVVELDGRAFHDTAASRNVDLDRDLTAAVERRLLTVRVGYAQVFRTGCRTATQVGALLARGGWSGRPQVCPRCG